MTERVSFFRGLLMLLIVGYTATLSIPAMADENKASCRIMRGLIVLVEFPGTPHTVKESLIEDRFFKKLNQYVQKMSYGRVCIGGEMTAKWITAPHEISHYRISSRNLDVDKSRPKRLVEDVLKAVDAQYDVSNYDFIALMLGATQSEYGMIGLCAYPGMLGWQDDKVFRTPSGKVINGVAIFSYQAHIGTLFHDIAHILGGVMANGNRAVPCLYDHDLQARPGPIWETFVGSLVNMGFWDPMSCHYYKKNEPPPGISSWTKLRLGWLPREKVAEVSPGQTREILLGPLEDGKAAILAIWIPLSAKSYYLIENRQPIGPDTVLPGSGILIMKADDSVAECRNGRAPVKLVDADPTVPHLEGAAFDVGRKGRFVDSSANLSVTVLAKEGQSYRILVGPRPLE